MQRMSLVHKSLWHVLESQKWNCWARGILILEFNRHYHYPLACTSLYTIDSNLWGIPCPLAPTLHLVTLWKLSSLVLNYGILLCYAFLWLSVNLNIFPYFYLCLPWKHVMFWIFSSTLLLPFILDYSFFHHMAGLNFCVLKFVNLFISDSLFNLGTASSHTISKDKKKYCFLLELLWTLFFTIISLAHWWLCLLNNEKPIFKLFFPK